MPEDLERPAPRSLEELRERVELLERQRKAVELAADFVLERLNEKERLEGIRSSVDALTRLVLSAIVAPDQLLQAHAANPPEKS